MWCLLYCPARTECAELWRRQSEKLEPSYPQVDAMEAFALSHQIGQELISAPGTTPCLPGLLNCVAHRLSNVQLKFSADDPVASQERRTAVPWAHTGPLMSSACAESVRRKVIEEMLSVNVSPDNAQRVWLRVAGVCCLAPL